MLQPYIESATALSCAPATSGQISYYWVELEPEFHCPTHIRILGNSLLTFLCSCSLFTYVLCQKRQSSVCNAMYENKIYSSSLHILERDVVKINQMILHLLLFDRILVIVLHCMAHRCQDFSLIGKVYSACK